MSESERRERIPAFLQAQPIEEHYCNLIVHMLNTAQFVPSKKYCAVKAAHSLSAFKFCMLGHMLCQQQQGLEETNR